LSRDFLSPPTPLVLILHPHAQWCAALPDDGTKGDKKLMHQQLLDPDGDEVKYRTKAWSIRLTLPSVFLYVLFQPA
jgi:hypothetical protein